MVEVLFLVSLTLYKFDLIEFKILITLGVGEMFAGFLGYFLGKWREEGRIKSEEESKQKKKLEQEQKKEAELQYEKSRISNLLLSEIEDIQKELKPLSNCRNKAFNEYNNISEEDKLPNELNFYSNICSNNGDKLELLDIKYQIKVTRYYKRIATIKEQYKKFKIIHDDLPEILSILELGEVRNPSSSPSVDEICKFLESTETAYILGEDLTKGLKN